MVGYSPLDRTLADAVGRGSIAFLSIYFLLHVRPDKISRRQDLEKLHVSPFLTRKQARRALLSQQRRILCLSYGWGMHGTPGERRALKPTPRSSC